MWFFLSFKGHTNYVTIIRNKKIRTVQCPKKIRTRYECGSNRDFEIFQVPY